MDKRLESKLRYRWRVLEDRTYQITAMLDELEELEEENISIKTTAVYMVLQKELEISNKEKGFIESLWKK